jgi:4-hydroxy-tetrahydrodipicolinate synthase
MSIPQTHPMNQRHHREQPVDFSGLWIPLITPFQPDGSVDTQALQGLLNHYCKTGIAGLVVNGTTGEPSSLSATEQLQALDLALQAAIASGKQVIAGLPNYSLSAALNGLVALNERPLSGVLVSAPAGIRPSQAGLLDWFRRLADASHHPLVVYDIPYRTGVVIERDTLLTLAQHPNIHAIKDCGGDLGKTLALIRHNQLAVLAGEDLQLFSSVAQGSRGGICASAHLHTEDFVAILDKLRTGDHAGALAQWLPLVPWIEQAFSAPNPAPVKAALAAQGRIQNVLRAPLQAVTLA